MRRCCASSGFSSILTFTRRTVPFAALTAFSRIGVSCLQGPHHGAQKSTMTGVVLRDFDDVGGKGLEAGVLDEIGGRRARLRATHEREIRRQCTLGAWELLRLYNMGARAAQCEPSPESEGPLGSCPQAAMKRRRPVRRDGGRPVVAQGMVVDERGVEHRFVRDRGSRAGYDRSMSAKGVTAPGFTPRTSHRSSGFPKLNRPAPRASDSHLRSTRISSRTTAR